MTLFIIFYFLTPLSPLVLLSIMTVQPPWGNNSMRLTYTLSLSVIQLEIFSTFTICSTISSCTSCSTFTFCSTITSCTSWAGWKIWKKEKFFILNWNLKHFQIKSDFLFIIKNFANSGIKTSNPPFLDENSICFMDFWGNEINIELFDTDQHYY